MQVCRLAEVLAQSTIVRSIGSLLISTRFNASLLVEPETSKLNNSPSGSESGFSSSAWAE
ncbi:hypothetical protein BZZ01_01260 [Nostocales cyanobacterium HT-58-2]|nr:hypothetical protein BZZ01_01260 [Nostocales cyanobacterium HT-58-2]